MKRCRFNKRIIDYIEDLMTEQDRFAFENHLKTCKDCEKEVSQIKKIYEILDREEVPMPSREFFEGLKSQIRIKRIPYRLPFWKIFGILAPVLGIIIFIILFNQKGERVIEIAVPISNLTLDEDLNRLLLDKIIDEKIINQFSVLEEYFAPDIEEYLENMNKDEIKDLIEIIDGRYQRFLST
uniref:Zf-HC2 domain-containing protein n=1 Tax=candidate division WOR-3 bacterium TaxID=2052148 RepID=A0A7C4TAD6_UNCW3